MHCGRPPPEVWQRGRLPCSYRFDRRTLDSVGSALDAVVAFLFKYPARMFARGDLVVAPVVPVLAIGGAALLALLFVMFAYSRVRTLRPIDRIVQIGRAHV